MLRTAGWQLQRGSLCSSPRAHTAPPAQPRRHRHRPPARRPLALSPPASLPSSTSRGARQHCSAVSSASRRQLFAPPRRHAQSARRHTFLVPPLPLPPASTRSTHRACPGRLRKGSAWAAIRAAQYARRHCRRSPLGSDRPASKRTRTLPAPNSRGRSIFRPGHCWKRENNHKPTPIGTRCLVFCLWVTRLD